MQQGPTFIIPGASKAGTEWLKRCLDEHPDVFMPGQAVNFFDYHYERGLAWYKACFSSQNNFARGEKSTSYIVNKAVPERIYQSFPVILLLFVLRNPIDRAYSHYKMNLRASLVNEHIERVLLPGNPLVEEGRYYMQLQRFCSFFPEDQIKILLYDDLKANPRNFLQQAYEYIRVDST